MKGLGGEKRITASSSWTPINLVPKTGRGPSPLSPIMVSTGPLPAQKMNEIRHVSWPPICIWGHPIGRERVVNPMPIMVSVGGHRSPSIRWDGGRAVYGSLEPSRLELQTQTSTRGKKTVSS